MLNSGHSVELCLPTIYLLSRHLGTIDKVLVYIKPIWLDEA
jgi:hypothetical protein